MKIIDKVLILLALTMTVFALEEEWEVIPGITAKEQKLKHASRFVNDERDEDEMIGIMYPVADYSQDNTDCGDLCEKCISDRKKIQNLIDTAKGTLLDEKISLQEKTKKSDYYAGDEMTGIMFEPNQNSEEHSEALCEKCIQRKEMEVANSMFERRIDAKGNSAIKYTNRFEYVAYDEANIKSIFDKLDLFIVEKGYEEYKKELRKRSISWYNYAYENRWYIGMTCLCFTGLYGLLRLT